MFKDLKFKIIIKNVERFKLQCIEYTCFYKKLSFNILK